MSALDDLIYTADTTPKDDAAEDALDLLWALGTGGR